MLGRSLFGITLAALPGCAAAESEPSPAEPSTVTLHTPAADIVVAVEVADEPTERQRGLMHRETLEERAGMVFIFPEDADHSFWMENTLIPLDMIFIDHTLTIVGIVRDAEPLTRTPRSVGRPSRYVLEVNGGFAQRHSVEAGMRVSLAHVPLQVAQ